MELEEIQKAVLLAIWYKPGDWQSPITLSEILNMTVRKVVLMASSLKRLGLLDSRTLSLKNPGRWGWKTTRTQYKLSTNGRDAVRAMLGVIDQTKERVML